MSDRPPAAGGTTGPAETSGGYGAPRWEPGPPAPGEPHPSGPYPTGPYAEGAPPPYTEGAPPFGEGAPPYAEGAPPYGEGAPPYGEGAPPPYGQGAPPPYGEGGPFGEGAPPYGTVPARPTLRLWPPTRPEWTVALAAVAALALLGAALAPLWETLAPRLAFRVDQPGRALPVVPEAEEYVAADGRFVLLTLAAGILVGLVCWLVRPSRGPLVLLALAAGGLLGAVVTWRLGLRLGPGYRPEDLQVLGKTVYQPLQLRARAGLVVEPIAAVVVYLLAAGFSSRTDLGRGDGPDDDPYGPGVSSGSG